MSGVSQAILRCSLRWDRSTEEVEKPWAHRAASHEPQRHGIDEHIKRNSQREWQPGSVRRPDRSRIHSDDDEGSETRRNLTLTEQEVYEKADVAECCEVTGAGPIGVPRVGISKCDRIHPKYRVRFVAKEFSIGVRPDLYVATPPSECMKLLLGKLATDSTFKRMHADVSGAYFYAKAIRPVYAQLTNGDVEDGDRGKCGELLVSICGTRDAAMNWSAGCTQTLIADGTCKESSIRVCAGILERR